MLNWPGQSATLRVLGWGLVLLWLGLPPAIAAELNPQPTSEPQLRIEAGMHTAPIIRIDTDAEGRFAVTGSADKTARVWEVASGRLLRVLRPPVGEGDEGKLYAVAISADGNTVAAAGWTKSGADQGNTVYTFDRATGQMMRRLTGLPSSIHHLSFSPDGLWLAATLGNFGLRVWDWRAGTEPLADPDFKATSLGASWGRDGRLVVSSFDGNLRLYQVTPSPGSTSGASLRKLKIAVAPGGKQPNAVAFHPDGSRVAVGYLDSPRVDVLDAGSLTLRYSPDIGGVNNGNLFSVAWRGDGLSLAAAGTWWTNGRYPLRRWTDEGRSPAIDVPTAGNTVMHLAALPGGAWLLAAQDPAWGVVSADGQWQPRGIPPIVDLRISLGDTFLLADGGRRIQFGSERVGQAPWHFDLRSRVLRPGKLTNGSPPQTSALPVTDWQDKPDPKLRGQPIALEPNESSRSIAITPDATGFVLGASFSLRYFDTQGQPKWRPQAVPGTVWGVNIPTDGPQAGKLVVAAYADGTIRWHRLSDGKELLAFFPHADGQRWVLWTPSGFFDGSPGAEDLIGWHVNRGRDHAADFFSASQLRERFYRPDVIDRVLDTLDEDQALAQANAAAGRREGRISVAQVLPPVVDAVAVPERFGSRTVTVRIRVRTPDGAPRTGLRVQVNGQFMALAPGPRSVDALGVEDLPLTLPLADSQVQIYAENRHGLSQPLRFTLQWAGDKAFFEAGEQAAVAKPKPRLWLLAVGVSRFKQPGMPPLAYADKDAEAFVATMRAQQGKAYSLVTPKLLRDADADRASVLAGLDWLKAQVQPGDTGMLFLAGHGYTIGADHRYYFAAHDTSPQRLPETGVPYSAIKDALVSFNQRGGGTHAVFFIDTCHAGDATGAQTADSLKASNARDLTQDLSRDENRVVVFASSKADQPSWEDPSLGHGVFTHVVIDGLGERMQADKYDLGKVTYKDLDNHLAKLVPRLSKTGQVPVLMAPGGVDDFVLTSR